MTILFSPNSQWKKLQVEIQNQLAPPEPVKVYPSRGLSEATLTALDAILSRYLKIKKIYCTKYWAPHLESVVLSKGRKGYGVGWMDLQALLHPEEFLSKIELDSSLIVIALDDPLMGKQFDEATLRAAIQEKQIPTIFVSHGPTSLTNKYTSLEKHEIHIQGLATDQSLVFVGMKNLNFEKIRFSGNWMSFSPSLFYELKNEPKETFYFEGVDGLAVIEGLAKSLDHTLLPPGQEDLMETTSPSRWGGLEEMSWLKNLGLSDDQIRGTIILDASLVNESLKELLSEAVQQIKHMQNPNT